MRHARTALLLTACLACVAASAAAADPSWTVSGADAFDAPGGPMWQPFPSATRVDDGVLTIEPPQSQQWLASAAKLRYGELDVEVVVTLYSKPGAPVTGEAIEVEARPGWHWVECLGDTEPTAEPAGKGRERLSLSLEAGTVACLSQMVRLMTVEPTAGGATVTLARKTEGARLVAYLDKDTGLPADGREVELKGTRVEVEASRLFGRKGKLILKLMRGPHLVDEAIAAPW
ncbi:MAG: hypothetical protein FJX75_10830 [Armatimonadetes bacterium]|nr:hypothetical protein [Armatimonadota bacterium]